MSTTRTERVVYGIQAVWYEMRQQGAKLVRYEFADQLRVFDDMTETQVHRVAEAHAVKLCQDPVRDQVAVTVMPRTQEVDVVDGEPSARRWLGQWNVIARAGADGIQPDRPAAGRMPVLDELMQRRGAL